MIVVILRVLDHESSAHEEWRNYGGNQDNSDHNCHLGSLKDSRAGSHSRNDQAHFPLEIMPRPMSLLITATTEIAARRVQWPPSARKSLDNPIEM